LIDENHRNLQQQRWCWKNNDLSVSGWRLAEMNLKVLLVDNSAPHELPVFDISKS
jgi:hypothetical protein